MNRGNIPGYYYDEEKKKYFKIQANHVAPTDAKYKKSNVQREQRETKKRRVEERHERRVVKQTVLAARSLRHPLIGGAGLLREHGDFALAVHRSQRDLALAHALNRRELQFEFPASSTKKSRISDAQYVRDSNTVFLATSFGPGTHCVYAQECSAEREWRENKRTVSSRAIWAFHDNIVGLARSKVMMVAYTERQNSFGGNVFARVFDESARALDGRYPQFHFNVGGQEDTLWDCKLQWDNNTLAFAGSSGVQLHAATPVDMVSLTNFPSLGSVECFAIDWIDHNTVAAGCRREISGDVTRVTKKKGAPRKHDISHEVYLCDLRSGGVASRLKCQNRITGIHVPNGSGTHVLVSGSRNMGLYDLRNLRPDAPLLSIDHLSGTTRLHTPTCGDLLAATDQYNRIQVYSLRSGRCLRAFAAPAARGLLSRPRWEEDYRGSPYLQACAANTIQQWSWCGPATDQAE